MVLPSYGRRGPMYISAYTIEQEPCQHPGRASPLRTLVPLPHEAPGTPAPDLRRARYAREPQSLHRHLSQSESHLSF